MERIEVIVNKMTRHYPVERVKIVGELRKDGADVIVVYPSYSVSGRVGAEMLTKLLTWRLLTGGSVRLPESKG